MWIATADRCRRMDRCAPEYGISVRQLMDRAGLAVFQALQEMVAPKSHIVFVCGKGNNGGDGLVAAALSAKSGYTVDCLIVANEGELSPLAAESLEHARASEVNFCFLGSVEFETRLENLSEADLVVDALLGTGVSGDVRDPALTAIRAINKSGAPVLAVDIPSGIETDTGDEQGESVWASRTVTFGLPKPGFFQNQGLEHSGSWSVADIGFPPELLNEPSEAKLLDCGWAANVLPSRLRSSHKGDNGSVLIVAGSKAMPGAASMAAQSALRSGAGLVTLASVESVCRAVSARIPECILLPLSEEGGFIAPSAARVLLESQKRYDAGVVGPGMGQSEATLELLRLLWSDWKLPSVIDADALNAVAKGVPLPGTECVLTPHPVEMGRLLQASAAEIQADRFTAVKRASERFDKCVLLKGPYSLVREDDQPTLVNRSGNAGMATGGMGDVLTGVIATLMGQSVPAYYAAGLGMYWHGLAADICAEEIGMVGYKATEVADALPKARAKIVSSCDYENCCLF